MNFEQKEAIVSKLEEKLLRLDINSVEFEKTKEDLEKAKNDAYSNMSAWEKVCVARNPKRIKASDLIKGLFTNFFELKGDQLYADDSSIISGIAFLDDIPVTVIAQAKGKNLNENLKRNFGMTSPEGFRKALRLAHQAEKFSRPIITIVDTSGAYPGKGAEERGQARAIAECLMEFSVLKTPVIAIVLSEGGSGGALALTISDYIYMFENAIYSVLSPEGFASILFKDTSKVKEVCDVMKLTSNDLFEYQIIDEIIKEPLGGINYLDDSFINKLKESLKERIKSLSNENIDKLIKNRYKKYRRIGTQNGD